MRGREWGMAYTLELQDDEVSVVVEALRIQRERWYETPNEEDRQ
jgi:hypothetical protein